MGFWVLDPTWVTLSGALMLVASVLCWLLIRRRRQRIWMPILRVVELENRFLPKLTMIRPPWLLFFCFLICATVLFVLTMKPKKEIFKSFMPNQTHVHVYFDFSPSVSLYLGIDEYRSKIESLMASLEGFGRVTYATSHSYEVLDWQDKEKFQDQIASYDFHRAGLKLGDTLNKHLEKLGDINILLIVSDRDLHSWEGFNWSYLEENMAVRFLNLASGREVTNFFIDKIEPVKDGGTDLSEWDVTISRSGTPIAGSGKLEVTFEQTEVYSGTWNLPQNKDSVELRVRWAASRLEPSSHKNALSEPLKWSIASDGSEVGLLDNVFRTYPFGLKKNILLIADNGGERFLEDPAHHLRVALQVQGLHVRRIDGFDDKGFEPYKDYPAQVVLAGLSREIDRQCPLAAQGVDSTGDVSMTGALPVDQPASIRWLVPISVASDWRVLCRCFSRFSGLEREAEPEFCKEVETREQYISVLRSVGAKQVGGSLETITDSLAWHFHPQDSKEEILAFTTPLRPDTRTGITYATLPILTKTLVNWQGLSLKKELENVEWPRTKSIANALALTGVDDRITNIPLGESLQKLLSIPALPPSWDPKAPAARNPASSKKTAEDPIPVLLILCYVALAVMALEVLYVLSRVVLKLSWRRRGEVALVLLAFCFGAGVGGRTASAGVELSLVGFGSESLRARLLAREISARTSITLEDTVASRSEFDPLLLKEPWLWAKKSSDVASRDGLLRPEVVRWVKKGGFLVIENAQGIFDLERLTRTNEFALKAGDGWSEIPPDHELMRSFHLLDSLPSCTDQLWYGYQFDGRIAILAIPDEFIIQLLDGRQDKGCPNKANHEAVTRAFVNVLMVALATDYKKDQIHLPEILKRLR